MTSVASTFTAAGVSVSTYVPPNTTLTYVLSGTWVGTVLLQKKRGGQVWETVRTYVANVSTVLDSGNDGDTYRWICTAYTSGTVTYSLTHSVVAATAAETATLATANANLANGLWVNDQAPTFTNATANRTNPYDYSLATTDARRKKAINLSSTVSKNIDLIEPAATNLLLQNNDFSTSWTALRMGTRTLNATTAPTGTAVATLVVEDGSVMNSHYLSQTFTKAASSLAYTFSVYAKKKERSEVELWIAGTAFTNSSRARFNLDYGYVATRQDGGSGFTLTDAWIEDVGSGWYRCVITATTDNTTALVTRISLCWADAGNTYTGDAVSGLYLWRGQVEQNTSVTTPIQTATVAVTKAADVLSCAVAASGEAGTIIVYAEEYGHEDSTVAREYLQGNADEDVFGLTANAGGVAGILDAVRGGTDPNAASSTLGGRFLHGCMNQFAVSWDATNVYLHVNGVLKTTTAKANAYNALTVLLFGKASTQPAAWVGAMLWNTKLATSSILGIFTAYGVAQAKAITCVGDSLTAGTKQNKAYPTQLRDLLNASNTTRSYVYQNAMPGDSSTSISTRMQADIQRLGYITVIWAGANNYTSASTVKTDIAAMIAAMTTTKYIVVSILPSNQASLYTAGANRAGLNTLNSDLATLYGAKFLSLLPLLQAAADGTPADAVYVANGVIPVSCMAASDIVHLNTKGYGVLAKGVYDLILENGY